eukprot:TRINITY_DN606_c0_g1_i1.p1 TRINITY_DN606_c0_g1~~TRINITY_DN606_c0_g1_i1.p1  ORF type:complete len:172 (-),score=45.62 TRINITY_DN606_c0_g1_i1:24-539(-)
MKYLVAVDTTQTSNAAFEYALGVLKPKDDVLYLISVVDQFHYYPDFLDVGWHAEASNDSRSVGDSLMELYHEKALQLGFQCEKITEVGSPVEKICKKVEELKIDVLLVGKKNPSLLDKLLLIGSVSEDCLRKAKCKVILVKNNTTASVTFHPEGKEEHKQSLLSGDSEQHK